MVLTKTTPLSLICFGFRRKVRRIVHKYCLVFIFVTKTMGPLLSVPLSQPYLADLFDLFDHA